MRWYSKNSGIARPLAVFVLLLTGGIVAEATFSTTETFKSAPSTMHQLPLNFETSETAFQSKASLETTGPYFDQDDPR